MAGATTRMSIQLGVDTSEVKKGFGSVTGIISTGATKINSALSGIGSIASAGVGGISALGSAVMSAGKYFMSFADNDAAKAIGALTRLSIMTGASTESLAGLQLASGQDVDTFSASMMLLTKNLAGVEVGSEGVRNKLANLGLDADKLAAMPLDKAILEIAATFEKLPSSTEKAALAFTLFGKKGADAMKILSRGKGGLEGMIKKAGDFGLGFSAKEGKDVGEALKAVKEFKLLKEGFSRQIALNLAPIATPVAKLFTDVGVSLMKGFKLAWDAARPFKDWLQDLSKSGLANIGEAIGGGITNVVKKASELLPIVDAWAKTFAAAGAAIGRWDGLWDGIKAAIPALSILDVNLASIKDEAMLTAWAFEYGFNNSGKAIEIFNANMGVAGGKITLFMSDLRDGFSNTFTYLKEVGEWAVTGLGTLFDRMLGNVTLKFKALGNALEKFMKDPTKGWQYEAPETASYADAWGGMPKFKDSSTPEDKLAKDKIKAAIALAEAKAAGLEKGFGQGLFEFIKQKKNELERGRDGTKFLGFDLKDFVGESAPGTKFLGFDLRDFIGGNAGGQATQGPGALMQNTVSAAQAELKFWRERSGGQGKSIAEKQLAVEEKQAKTLDNIEGLLDKQEGDFAIP